MPDQITDVGNELAELPIGDLLHSMAKGIADGQRALDLTSVETLILLSNTNVSLIPEITEVIEPQPIVVQPSGQPPITVTGVRVEATPSNPVTMSALQAGIVPTFYQFTEAVLQLKLSLQMHQAEQTDTSGTRRTGFFMFGSNVNFKSHNTYSYSAEGSSTLTATLRPVPAPARVVPSTILVNATGPTPTVTTNV
jgi:hypothetical protein